MTTPIITVTLNPAVDLTVTLDELVPGSVHRARDAQSSPIPLPPALEERRYYPEAYHANRAKRAASRAIDAEFNTTDPDVIQL